LSAPFVLYELQEDLTFITNNKQFPAHKIHITTSRTNKLPWTHHNSTMQSIFRNVRNCTTFSKNRANLLEATLIPSSTSSINRKYSAQG
jgi:hypothetical protein